jgi:hypothetical protein
MLGQGTGASVIANEGGVQCQTACRIRADPVAAETMLARWEREAV